MRLPVVRQGPAAHGTVDAAMEGQPCGCPLDADTGLIEIQDAAAMEGQPCGCPLLTNIWDRMTGLLAAMEGQPCGCPLSPYSHPRKP